MNKVIIVISISLTVVMGFPSAFDLAQTGMANDLPAEANDRGSKYTKDGFNLDLSYITPNIIGMTFPYPDKEKKYNAISEVKRFMDKYHKDHYLVINLRLIEEDPINAYTAAAFDGHGVYFGFQDVTPPEFELLLKIIGVANDWLQKDPKNIIAVHCKAGWGRTGTIISSELLYSGFKSTAKAAYDYFSAKREVVPIMPSQKRYVGYMETYLKNGRMYKPVPLVINSIRLGTAKSTFDGLKTNAFALQLTQAPNRTVSGLEIKEAKKDGEGTLLVLKKPAKVNADFRLDVIIKGKTKMALHFWLNTAFLDASGKNVTLSRMELDDPSSALPSDLIVTMFYTTS